MQFCIINPQHPSHDCFCRKWCVQPRGIAACTAHTIYWHSSVVVQTMASWKVLHINESCFKKKKKKKKWLHISFLLWSFQSFRISTTFFVATFAQKSYVSYFVYFCLFSKQKRFHAWLLPAVSRTSVGGKGLLLPFFCLFLNYLF